MSEPHGDRVAAVPVQVLTATFNAFRSFATTVGRLQVDLLHAVAGEHARSEADLADWALEMYSQLRRAVELHTSALQRLVPPTGADTLRPDSQSWVEDSAAELGRILNTLAHDDAALISLLLTKVQPPGDAPPMIVLPAADPKAA
jgi:hypothetical protein